MNDIVDHNPDDLLTEYGTATTAYLLMAMSIDSLEHRNKQLETENAKLRELMYERAHVYAIQNMTEDELRITATNVMEDNAKLRELVTSYLRRIRSPVGPTVERDYMAEFRALGIEVD